MATEACELRDPSCPVIRPHDSVRLVRDPDGAIVEHIRVRRAGVPRPWEELTERAVRDYGADRGESNAAEK